MNAKVGCVDVTDAELVLQRTLTDQWEFDTMIYQRVADRMGPTLFAGGMASLVNRGFAEQAVDVSGKHGGEFVIYRTAPKS